MRKRIFKAVGWLLGGIACAVLTVLFFRIEFGRSRRYSLTVGCGLLTVVCLLAVYWSLTGKMTVRSGKMIVEDIFKMKTGGCVVTGTIQGGFYAGERVRISGRTGEMIRTKIYAIEIRHQKVKSAIDTPAALYLKKVDPEDIRKGSVIYNAES